jgi:hypothetical protein
VISLFNFLRHKKQAGKRHEYAADTHLNPPEWADIIRIPKNTAAIEPLEDILEWNSKKIAMTAKRWIHTKG